MGRYHLSALRPNESLFSVRRADGLYSSNATGLTGKTGATGAAGTQILGPPTHGVGAVGDFYLELDTGILYGPKA
jgi:hypothetical protein